MQEERGDERKKQNMCDFGGHGCLCKKDLLQRSRTARSVTLITFNIERYLSYMNIP